MLTAAHTKAQTDPTAVPDNSAGSFVEQTRAPGPWTYDLRTVRLIDPGRFTIIAQVLDSPDVMNLRLKVLDTLRTYCGRSEGQYPAPATLFALGAPDLPVQPIEVTSNRKEVETLGAHPHKWVNWRLPYGQLGIRNRDGMIYQSQESMFCGSGGENDDSAHRSVMNGTRLKYLYDCRRGLEGTFINLNNDSSEARISPVRVGTIAEDHYLAVCRRVTGKEPYHPKLK
jgi:hypothetical protein